jgi:hypothetical protein
MNLGGGVGQDPSSHRLVVEVHANVCQPGLELVGLASMTEVVAAECQRNRNPVGEWNLLFRVPKCRFHQLLPEVRCGDHMRAAGVGHCFVDSRSRSDLRNVEGALHLGRPSERRDRTLCDVSRSLALSRLGAFAGEAEMAPNRILERVRWLRARRIGWSLRPGPGRLPDGDDGGSTECKQCRLGDPRQTA